MDSQILKILRQINKNLEKLIVQKTKAQNNIEIEHKFNKDKIKEVKQVSDADIEDAVIRASEWMINNPKKISDNSLRTGRVLQFLSDKPNKNAKQGIIREY